MLGANIGFNVEVEDNSNLALLACMVRRRQKNIRDTCVKVLSFLDFADQMEQLWQIYPPAGSLNQK